MILYSYASMRTLFAAPPKTITGATNASPIVLTAVGHGITVTGSMARVDAVTGNTAANGIWPVTVVDANHVSLDGSTGNGAYGGGGTLTPLANDGFPVWPVSQLRAGGIPAISGDNPPLAWPTSYTVDASVDPTPHLHRYRWYLSQRTDDPALQYLTLSQPDPLKSGIVAVGLNLTNVAKLLPGRSGADLLTPDALTLILANVALYVQRISDGAYTWCQLYPTDGSATGPV